MGLTESAYLYWFQILVGAKLDMLKYVNDFFAYFIKPEHRNFVLMDTDSAYVIYAQPIMTEHVMPQKQHILEVQGTG